MTQRELFPELDLVDYWQRCNHCGHAATIDNWGCSGLPEQYVECPKCLKWSTLRWITDRPMETDDAK